MEQCVSKDCDSTPEEDRKGLALIQTILGEMKSEFNKDLKIPDVKKEIDEKGSKRSNRSEQYSRAEKKDLISVEKKNNTENTAFSKEDAVGYASTLLKKNDPNSCFVGLKLSPDNLKSPPEFKTGIDNSRMVMLKTLPESANGPVFVKIECANETQGVSAQGKRSLRSQVVKSTPEEPSGVKRSARRRSKDSPRESVLQSAIARKEKSFSNLGQNDDKPHSSRGIKVGSQRAVRLGLDKSHTSISKGSSASRNSGDAKKLGRPLKAFQKRSLIDPESMTVVASVKTRNADTSKTSPKGQGGSNVNDLNVLNNKPCIVTNSKSCQKSSSQSVNTVGQTYTKTGKRRYKPYKGLRYSFSSNNAKKNKITRQRTLSETAKIIIGISDKHMIARKSDVRSGLSKSSVKVTPANVPNLENVTLEDSLMSTEDIDKSFSVPPSLNDEVLLHNIEHHTCEEYESHEIHNHKQFSDGISVAGIELKRFDSDEYVDVETIETEVPSSVDKSDLQYTEDETTELCLCEKETSLFLIDKTSDSDIFHCQAYDCLNHRLVGCLEKVNAQETSLLRASVQTAFSLLCDVHRQRMLRHHCCATCGNFCTQGRFMVCDSNHFYHLGCSYIRGNSLVCPHCGLQSASGISLIMSTDTTPIFLPRQKPTIKRSTARITATSRTEVEKLSSFEEMEDDGIQEGETNILDSSLHSKGIPLPLDKEKLTQLVNVVCSMQVASDQENSTARCLAQNLFIAAKTGNAEKILQSLAAGIDANHLFSDSSMQTALHIASADGNLAAVHILLQSGAQIDLMDQDQNTPLILACQNGHNDIVEYLIKAGASITLKGGDGMTALHVAAKTGNLEACNYLLSVPNIKNSFIDCTDDGGWTSLVWAIDHCHTEVAKFLLKKRADPLIRDVEQNIAIHWSAYSGCVDVAEMLINLGSEINCVNVHGDTPLHIGARQDKYECVLLLLVRGARVDLINVAGDTALSCCLERNNDCYVAIKLNFLLSNLVLNIRRPSQKILCNDISRGKEANPIQCVNNEDDEDEPKDYVYVSRNCYTSNINIDQSISSLKSCQCTDNCTNSRCTCGLMSAQCWYDDEGKLLPDFNYADAPMIFECNQCCGCNQVTCNNRVVQHGLTARFQLFRTQRQGWGVRSLTLIPKGTFVCEYIGEIISDYEADNRDDDTYLFDLDNRDGETYCIDARYYGNIARFINHMCMPNLLAVRVFIDHQDLHFPRMAFFANRDIQPMEELGFDYGDKFWAVKCKSFTCSCGAETCRYSEAIINQTLISSCSSMEQ